MKYLYDVPFSTPAATDAYRANWDAIFGKKTTEVVEESIPDTEKEPPQWTKGDCPCESGKPFAACHGNPEGE